jgi:hypothetical protein
MGGRADTDELRERVREVQAVQSGLLALSETQFQRFCWDVATMRRDSVPGLLERLRRQSTGGELFRLDPRVTALRRAEEMVVDQLDREQLQARLTEGRLTAHMCDYWLRRRPKEIPRINGLPLWLAVFSADVAA